MGKNPSKRTMSLIRRLALAHLFVTSIFSAAVAEYTAAPSDTVSRLKALSARTFAPSFFIELPKNEAGC
jgi:hypothetical protein